MKENIVIPDAILLAAGGSTRFGGNKLFFPVNGKPMYRSVFGILCRLQRRGLIGHIIIVTGSDALAAEVGAESAGSDPHICVVMNRQYEAGISRSIRMGLQALQSVHPGSVSCLFSVADQPYISEASLERLIRGSLATTKNITACSAGKIIGNPVIFSDKYYAELSALTGDRGGKKIVLRHPDDTELVDVPEEELADLDTAKGMEIEDLTDNGRDTDRVSADGSAASACSRFDRLWLPGDLAPVSPEEAFPFLNKSRGVISLVGAGGKTTLIYFLADALVKKGKRVLVTTSTHIWRPDEAVMAGSAEDAEALWKRGSYAVIGANCQESKAMTGMNGNNTVRSKIMSPDPHLLSACMEKADFTLIEADGSRQMPSKVPGEHEPVIPAETDAVIGVMGLSAVGGKLSDVCFRSELIKNADFMAPMLKRADIMTPALAATILSSERGTRKNVGERDFYIVLNQCDDPAARSTAEEIGVMLKYQNEQIQGCGRTPVVFSSLRAR
ncbi:MAG: selenium cofactor biosynthesis protein YqeC [Eubacteriales bacterium]|jgi:probable selenium-dependent hydroxylase accessory protein YqeC